MIHRLLKNKIAKERANIKAREIAKLKIPRKRIQFSGADYEIEIKDLKVIEGGIEFYARAWHPDGSQVGFGEDGTVEWERFRIFNPPILVDDPNGDIIREWMDERTGELKQRKLREDPQEAILQSLVHTIMVSTKDKPRGKIISGKHGNTTSTFYPSFDDGWETDNVVRNWTDTENLTSANLWGSTAINFRWFGWRRQSGGFQFMNRAAVFFDVSSIGSDIVSSATASFWAQAKLNETSDSPSAAIYTFSNSSNTSIATTDFNKANFGNAVSDTSISFASFSTTGYNDYSFNSTGISHIQTALGGSGIVKLGLRDSVYDAGTNTPNTGATADIYLNVYSVDQTGTANDPKLVVIHNPPPSFEGRLITNAPGVFYRKPKILDY